MPRATIPSEMPVRRLTVPDIASCVRARAAHPARTRPVVAVTTNPHYPNAAMDADRLAIDIGDAADVVALETGEATWALGCGTDRTRALSLPEGAGDLPQLFGRVGGQVRVSPLGGVLVLPPTAATETREAAPLAGDGDRDPAR